MSQHDFNIGPEVTPAQLRQELNVSLAALASNSEGTAEPPVTFAGMFWCDRNNGQLKQRNLANTAWIVVGMLDKIGLAIPTLTRLAYRLNANLTGQDVDAAQSLLGASASLAANTIYEFQLIAALSKTAGATPHDISIGFGGTCTLNNIGFYVETRSSSAGSISTPAAVSAAYLQTRSQTVLSGSLASAASHFLINARGMLSVSAAGTLIPQYKLSAAPGGPYSTQMGAFMALQPLGDSGTLNLGSWG